MKTYSGSVVGGYYLNLKTWSLETVEKDGDCLPAGDFVRLPFLAVLAWILGLSFAFVVFLPFIGFWMLGRAAWLLLRRR